MALKFLHRIDYQDIIKTDELETITDGDSDLLRQAENKAIGKVKKYLLRKYDVDALFSPIQTAQVGTAQDTRDVTLVEYTLYFTLYILYGRVAKRAVPEDRYMQYKEARDFFKDVQQDLVTPGWPLKIQNGKELAPAVHIASRPPLSHDY